MDRHRKTPRMMFLALFITALAACGGGGGSSSASSFAEAVGVGSTQNPAPAATPTLSPAPPAWPNARWVDFQNGNDNSDGKSKATAWKHAPGDTAASGVAAAFKPAAGEQIVFAAGSRYFGAISASFTGTAGAPVVLTGETPDQTAVIDGSAASAQSQSCTSQAACYGVGAWQSVSIVKFAEALPASAQLYSNGALLTPAQWPNPADLFYNEEVDAMAEETGVRLNAGTATVPVEVTNLIKSIDDTRIAVWVQSNKIVERRVRAVKDGQITFDNNDISAYTDRPSKFALRGHAAMIDMAGEYAILPDRKTVLVKTGGANSMIYASSGRGGIDLSGASHVVVRNLAFEHMSDVDGNVRSGVPISAMSKPAANLTIENNRFNDIVLFQGMGAITLWDVNNVAVRANTIQRVAYGSGMRILRSKNGLIFGNVVERVGRTGIMLMNNTDVKVVKNQIRDIMGVHGNGFSAYLGNQRTEVIANTITEAKQPATFNGNGDLSPKAEDILFANNLFIGSDDSLGALISWGKNGDKIRLINNVLLGGNKGALRLSDDDRNLTVRRNVIAGIILPGVAASDWILENNTFTFLSNSQTKYAKQDTVLTQLAGPALAGKAPGDLQKYCPYVTEMLDFVLLGHNYGKSIGATFTCG